MSKASQSKGKKGEREAKRLLEDRDFTILADTSAGLSTDDLVIQAADGKIYSVEVKNTKAIDIPKYRTQAKTNAKKLDWLLLCKIDQTSSWLVMGKNRLPVVWHSKGGE